MAMTEPASPPITDEEPNESANDSATDRVVKICTQTGCGNTFEWVQGMGKRSKCDEHFQGSGRRVGRPRKSEPEDEGERVWTIEDAISVPLSKTEREMAARIAILVRLSGAIVYRMNVTDGLIVQYHTDKLAEGLVIEARTSEGLRKMVKAMASFSGAGPLALVLVQMSLEIAANHNVPVFGNAVKIPEQILRDAEQVHEVRARRPVKAEAKSTVPQGSAGFAECPQCHRRAIGVPGTNSTCVFCQVPVPIPV